MSFLLQFILHWLRTKIYILEFNLLSSTYLIVMWFFLGVCCGVAKLPFTNNERKLKTKESKPKLRLKQKKPKVLSQQ
jgi:hypothetical protein